MASKLNTQISDEIVADKYLLAIYPDDTALSLQGLGQDVRRIVIAARIANKESGTKQLKQHILHLAGVRSNKTRRVAYADAAPSPIGC